MAIIGYLLLKLNNGNLEMRGESTLENRNNRELQR